MATANRTEYVAVNGLPLSTPAWKTLDTIDLYGMPATRGNTLIVPGRTGVQTRRRAFDARRAVFPMVVYGNVDSDGAAHANLLTGLRENFDELNRYLRPRQNTHAGTRTLEHYLYDGTVREAPCQVLAMDVSWRQRHAVVALEVLIPGGVLRSDTVTSATSATVASGGTGTLVVPNAGNTDQFDSVITITPISGTATTVRLTSQTWSGANDQYLEWTGTLGAAVTIDTGAFTATKSGSSVIGEITPAGPHPAWLPLVPDNNTVKIEPVGGSVQVTVDHYAPYA